MCDQINLNNRPKVQNLFCNHCGVNFRGEIDGLEMYVNTCCEIGLGPKDIVRCRKCNRIVNDEVGELILKWFWEINERQNMLIEKGLIDLSE